MVTDIYFPVPVSKGKADLPAASQASRTARMPSRIAPPRLAPRDGGRIRTPPTPR